MATDKYPWVKLAILSNKSWHRSMGYISKYALMSAHHVILGMPALSLKLWRILHQCIAPLRNCLSIVRVWDPWIACIQRQLLTYNNQFINISTIMLSIKLWGAKFLVSMRCGVKILVKWWIFTAYGIAPLLTSSWSSSISPWLLLVYDGALPWYGTAMVASMRRWTNS